MSVTIIAEIGVNHNGDMDLARRLIEGAAEAGAQYAKFQSFKAASLATASAAKAAYQRETTDATESQLEMLRRLELSEEQHHQLRGFCAAAGIEFLSSAFDPESLEFLTRDLALPTIKFGSGELTNAPLLFAAARSGVNLILSSGMASLGEIEEALMVVNLGYAPGAIEQPRLRDFRHAWADQANRARIKQKVSLLHCTTSYPAAAADINLAAMSTLREAFGLTTGYSDHTPGDTAAVAAVALGAQIIEKHITLDRSLPGPDHRASIELPEFARMVTGIRYTETIIGEPFKVPRTKEIEIASVARKSLVAARPISANELFTNDNLTIKRPGTGIPPIAFWEYLGQPAKRNYAADELID